MDAVNMTPGNTGTVVKHPGMLYSLMLISAMAVIVFSVAGIVAMMGWMPGTLSSDAGPAKPRVATTPIDCRDCGVVESLRAVEKSVNFEIRVRMHDGTYRTFYERARPALAIGQKVRVTGRGLIAAS